MIPSAATKSGIASVEKIDANTRGYAVQQTTSTNTSQTWLASQTGPIARRRAHGERRAAPRARRAARTPRRSLRRRALRTPPGRRASARAAPRRGSSLVLVLGTRRTAEQRGCAGGPGLGVRGGTRQAGEDPNDRGDQARGDDH